MTELEQGQLSLERNQTSNEIMRDRKTLQCLTKKLGFLTIYLIRWVFSAKIFLALKDLQPP